jgi:anthranilate synthase component 1
LTPVLAYRRLVLPDERTAPSFLFESVENGTNVGRHSILGARPVLELSSKGFATTIVDHRRRTRRSIGEAQGGRDPLALLRELAAPYRPASREALASLKLPAAFTGGFVGFASFDSVRYLEPEKLSFERAPKDDRAIPDLHFGLYQDIVVFDHVAKTLHAIVSARIDEFPTRERAFASLVDRLDALEAQLAADGPRLAHGAIDIDLARRPEQLDVRRPDPDLALKVQSDRADRHLDDLGIVGHAGAFDVDDVVEPHANSPVFQFWRVGPACAMTAS